MVFQLEVVPDLVTCAVQVVLAVVLLGLRFNDRANRALAFVLLARTGNLLFGDLARIADNAADAAFWLRLRPYVLLPYYFSVLYFLTLFPKPRAWLPRSVPAWAPFVAASLVVEALYLWDHRLATGTGALAILSNAVLTLLPICALVTLRDHLRAPQSPQAGSLLLVSAGFLLVQFYDDARSLAIVLAGLAGAGAPAPVATYTLALLFVRVGLQVGVLALLARGLGRADVPHAPLRRYLVFGFLGGASAFAIIGLGLRGTPWDIFLAGLWNLALPVLVSYALLRKELFGIDLKVKWTIRRGTVAAIFLAVFLVVTQVAQNALSQDYGVLFGGAAAGLMLFAIAPVQRFAENLANAALPNARPVAEMSAEDRRALYREQARVAWADGKLSMDERQLLSSLRARLGMTDDEAFALEREVAPAEAA